MNHKFLLTGLFLLFSGTLSWAQNLTVSGTVTAAADKLPLSGVNVVIKNTTRGTITDQQGKFQLLSKLGDTLVFSAIGFVRQESVLANQEPLEIVLLADVRQLDQIVITALGLEEDRDRFTAASSQVKGNALLRSGETSLLTALSGKVPGVLVSRSSGDPGAGASLQIRGQSSITGNLQPLIVIDGVPVYNSTFSDEGILAGAGELNNQSGGVVQQSRLNDINPDDIAAVEVLRGASAAALWGTRAANGVIVIRTKRGSNSDGKPRISFRASYGLDQVTQLPDLQTAYGQGVSGLYFSSGPASLFSWGDKIASRVGGPDDFLEPGEIGYQGVVTFPDGSQRYAVASGTPANPHGGKRSQDIFDPTKNLFRTGYTSDNSLSINGGDDRSTYFVSLGKTYTQGVIKRNSDYDRTTFRVNATHSFGKRLHSGVNIAYTHVRSNRVQQGNNQDGLLLSALRTPPDFNNAYFEGNYTDPAGVLFPRRHISYRNPIGAIALPTALHGPVGSPGFANPLWTLAHNQNDTKVDRIIGNLEWTYKATDWLQVINRTGVDRYTDKRTALFPLQSASFLTGSYRDEAITETQLNNDLLVQVSKEFSADFRGTLLTGLNLNHREADQVGAQVSNLLNPFSPPQLQNSSLTSRLPFNATSIIRTGALYGQLDVQTWQMLYFSLTGRAETASTFGNSQRTFFYPSAGVAWQFTKLAPLADSRWLSFGKLRLAYGVVGVQPGAYQTRTYFPPADPTQIGETFEPTLDAVAYGGGFIQSGVRGNPNLKPERKTELEAGLDLRLLQDRVQFSGTYYVNKTQDVILQVPLPASSGFRRTFDNAASVENRGWEFQLDANLIKTSRFAWTLSPNWSKNTNKVTDLKGAESVTLLEVPGASSRAVEGYPLGVFWGTRRLRGENGALILDANGFPRLDPTEGVVGNPNPKWRAGLGTTFSYKKLTLYALFDHVHKTDVANGTKASLYFFGTHADTGVETTVSAEDAAVIKNFSGKTLNQLYPAGENGSVSFRGRVSDFGAGPVALDQAWYQGLGGGFVGPLDQFVETINISRLREVSLAYTLNTPGFQRASRLQSIDFAVTARNVLLWTNYTGVDPETNVSGPSNARGIEISNNPGTRSFIFSVRINY
jgi:TonB-linked SusC/RagA family outer membrane protein